MGAARPCYSSTGAIGGNVKTRAGGQVDDGPGVGRGDPDSRKREMVVRLHQPRHGRPSTRTRSRVPRLTHAHPSHAIRAYTAPTNEDILIFSTQSDWYRRIYSFAGTDHKVRSTHSQIPGNQAECGVSAYTAGFPNRWEMVDADPCIQWCIRVQGWRTAYCVLKISSLADDRYDYVTVLPKITLG